MEKTDLMGTWRLVRHGLVSTEGVFTPTGEEMAGLLIYTPEGAMSVLITKKKTPSTLDDIVAYAGSYSLSGNQVTHHVHVAAQSKRVGADEIRIASREGFVLTLRSEPTASGRYEIVWELT